MGVCVVGVDFRHGVVCTPVGVDVCWSVGPDSRVVLQHQPTLTTVIVNKTRKNRMTYIGLQASIGGYRSTLSQSVMDRGTKVSQKSKEIRTQGWFDPDEHVYVIPHRSHFEVEDCST